MFVPKLSALIVILLIMSPFAAAQEISQPISKPVSGGVVSGRAIRLLSPVYPPAAKSAGAGGLVPVQVLIDESGSVIEAAATGGHPLLRAAAVAAARQSKFAPVFLSGQPTKVTGVINYNFVHPNPRVDEIKEPAGTSFDWKSVGYALGDAETEIGETSDLSDAAEILYEKFPAESDAIKLIIKNFEDENVREQFAAFDAVTAVLRGKIYPRADLWNFEIGLTAGKIIAGRFDETVVRQNLPKFRALNEYAPEESVPTLEKLIAFAEQSSWTRRDKIEIEKLLESLL